MNRCKLFWLIAIAGVLCTIFGAWKKAFHHANADVFLFTGMIAEGIGLAALAWFLFNGLVRKDKRE